MIKIKSMHEITLMREAGRIASEARAACGKLVKPGVTTLQLDMAARHVIAENKAIPSFLNYGGFPAAICCSINDEVIHGIPGGRVVQEGDIVSIDVGAIYKGYHGDCAATFAAGVIDEGSEKLISVTRQSFYEGIMYAREGYRISDISHAVQEYCESNGFSVVRDYVGHGVGSDLHEEPEVPNFGRAGRGPRLVAGMTIAVEPMVNAGAFGIKRLSDGWTVKTIDGLKSAHYENTILITKDEPIILTACSSDNHE